MAEQIILTGKFDLAKTYESVESWKDAWHISDMSVDRGMFMFEIRGMETVNIEIFGTGKVIINTDDFADPAELIAMIEARLRTIDHDRPVKLRLEDPKKHIRFLPVTAELIAKRALWVEEWSAEPSLSVPARDVIVKLALARRKRIIAQCRHPNAGEIEPGRDGYLRDLNHLGIPPSEVDHWKGQRIFGEIDVCMDESGDCRFQKWEEDYEDQAEKGDWTDFLLSRFEETCIFDLEIEQAKKGKIRKRARCSHELADAMHVPSKD